MLFANLFFQRNASQIARYDAQQDNAYRIVWDALRAAGGVLAANRYYAQVRWVAGENISQRNIVDIYRDLLSYESARWQKVHKIA